MANSILQVVDLHKSYGANKALGGVSLEVPSGEIFGLLGPNGAGKTTLLSILAGLIKADSGRVLLDGKEFSGSEAASKCLIGIVPQELAIYGELSARENLRFFGELYGKAGPALEAGIDEVVEAVGLRGRADDRAATYSGGMKRRLNLGIGLVHGPRLLLLDEPTAGVDPQSRNAIFDEVRRRNEQGVTIIYTSHYMEEVQALCTRVGIIDQGKLIACDRLEPLLKRLPGLIRVKIQALTPELEARLGKLGGLSRVGGGGLTLELECRAVKTTLVHLLAALTEEQVELTSLETEEPNLERVFLHLTGRGLRD